MPLEGSLRTFFVRLDREEGFVPSLEFDRRKVIDDWRRRELCQPSMQLNTICRAAACDWNR